MNRTAKIIIMLLLVSGFSLIFIQVAVAFIIRNPSLSFWIAAFICAMICGAFGLHIFNSDEAEEKEGNEGRRELSRDEKMHIFCIISALGLLSYCIHTVCWLWILGVQNPLRAAWHLFMPF